MALTEAHTAELVRRFDAAPKPMYYQPQFLNDAWRDYGRDHPGPVDPDAFIRWTYARALAHRQPRYAAMARRGVTVGADEVAALTHPADFEALIARVPLANVIYTSARKLLDMLEDLDDVQDVYSNVDQASLGA